MLINISQTETLKLPFLRQIMGFDNEYPSVPDSQDGSSDLSKTKSSLGKECRR